MIKKITYLLVFLTLCLGFQSKSWAQDKNQSEASDEQLCPNTASSLKTAQHRISVLTSENTQLKIDLEKAMGQLTRLKEIDMDRKPSRPFQESQPQKSNR